MFGVVLFSTDHLHVSPYHPALRVLLLACVLNFWKSDIAQRCQRANAPVGGSSKSRLLADTKTHPQHDASVRPSLRDDPRLRVTFRVTSRRQFPLQSFDQFPRCALIDRVIRHIFVRVAYMPAAKAALG